MDEERETDRQTERKRERKDELKHLVAREKTPPRIQSIDSLKLLDLMTTAAWREKKKRQKNAKEDELGGFNKVGGSLLCPDIFEISATT